MKRCNERKTPRIGMPPPPPLLDLLPPLSSPLKQKIGPQRTGLKFAVAYVSTQRLLRAKNGRRPSQRVSFASTMVVPQVGGVGDAVGPEQWFRSLPVITQYWFGGTLIITLAANFGIVDPAQLVFSWLDIRNQFQLWRLATSFLYVGPFEFGTLIAVYMLVNFSKIYEAGGPYNTGAGGGTADYAFMMLFAMALMLLSYPIIGSMLRLWPLFSRNLIYFVLYVWSKRNPTAQANIWGIPVQGVYLPFAYLALHVFMGSPYMDMLHGMAIGHLYYFLVDVVPQVQGKDILLVRSRFHNMRGLFSCRLSLST